MFITIFYVSITGNTERVAEYIKEGMQKIEDIDIKLMNLVEKESIDLNFIKDSQTVVFGSPTYVASICWQWKKWFDTEWDCDLSGKLGGAFATANCLHGGGDLAILSLLQHLLVRGMLVYSSGTEYGRPFIHLGPIALRDKLESRKDIFVLFGQRMAEKTLEIFAAPRKRESA